MQTEATNPNSHNLDQLTSLELVNLFSQEDYKVLEAVQNASGAIAQAIDICSSKITQGGKLYYFGAGTSGRIGILDAVEWPPTFSTPSTLATGIIAGGDPAIFKAVEGAEDNYKDGYLQAKIRLKSNDIFIGIAASGNTPFVLGAQQYALDNDIANIAIANNKEAALFKKSMLSIFLDTGPEILSGSTRLKAGTSQKITLNIISTSSMIKLGKTYGNLMVDVKASNEKLKKRAKRLVQEISKCNASEAEKLLNKSNYKVKEAIVMHLKKVDLSTATKYLNTAQGKLRKIIES